MVIRIFIFMSIWIFALIILDIIFNWPVYRYWLGFGPRVPAPGYKIMTNGSVYTYKHGDYVSIITRKYMGDIIDVTWRRHRNDLKESKQVWKEVESK